MIQHEEFDVRIDHFRLSQLDCKRLRQQAKNHETAVLATARPITVLREHGVEVSPCGGYTIAEVYYGEKKVAEAKMVCSPFDNFNKYIGRQAASGRALHALKKEMVAA